MAPRIDTPLAINERNQAIYERRQQGESYADIARGLAISNIRVQQIVKNVQMKIDFQRNYPILTGDEITLQSSVLSVFERRVAGSLYRQGFSNLQQIVDLMVVEGWSIRSYPENPYRLYLGNRPIRNIGRISWKKITAVFDKLGFDLEQYRDKKG